MKKRIASALIVIAALSGCSTNPVTGKSELNFVSEAQELSIGEKQYAPMRQSQGGDYVVDKQLTAYVNEVGQKLAKVSDRKLPYEFKVLNSSVPNAWALPGGKIVLNRGLLTELKSESELAAVLGHEITHAAAKHTARSMSRGTLMQGLMMATVIASQGKDYAQLAQLGAGLGGQLVTQKYGRDAERESDYYGMLYMSRAGYDPKGAVDLQETFVRLSEGKNQDWLSGLFASHPPSPERVKNNKKRLTELPKGGIVGSKRFKQKTAYLLKKKPAYKAYDEARKALAKDETSKAKKLAKKALKIEPREAHFYALLGDIEQKGKRYKQARSQYDIAIRNNSNFFYYYLQRGLANEALNADKSAKKDLQRSIKLLPTANAYYSLGNIFRSEGNQREAKSYYAKAAQNKSKTGKDAYGALVDMDLSKNPSQYLEVRTGLNKKGRLVAQLSNPTPRNVAGIELIIQLRDSAGRVKETNRSLRGTLKAGSKEVIDLGISGLTKEQARGLKARIVGARIMR